MYSQEKKYKTKVLCNDKNENSMNVQLSRIILITKNKLAMLRSFQDADFSAIISKKSDLYKTAVFYRDILWSVFVTSEGKWYLEFSLWVSYLKELNMKGKI